MVNDMTDDEIDDGMGKFNVLIVDDEEEVLDVLSEVIKSTELFDSKVVRAENGDEALSKIEDGTDLVLADYKMPGMNGVELLVKVKEMDPDIIRMLITGYSEVQIAKDAINKADVHYYLEKPWDNEELLRILNRELRRKEDRVEMGSKEVEGAIEALEILKELQNSFKSFSKIHPGIVSIPKGGNVRHFIFEFSSSDEFNDFSFELKENSDIREKVGIEDVQIFENRYLVKVSVKP